MKRILDVLGNGTLNSNYTSNNLSDLKNSLEYLAKAHSEMQHANVEIKKSSDYISYREDEIKVQPKVSDLDVTILLACLFVCGIVFIIGCIRCPGFTTLYCCFEVFLKDK